jgi:uncharacterized protein (TIGR02594 family)
MEPTKYIVNTKSDPLAVRKEPNGDSTGIAKNKGTPVVVTEIKNGWAKIAEGWVSEQFLLKEQTSTPIAATGTPHIIGFTEGRAPWMKIVLEEAKKYGGHHEGEEPLKSRIQSTYFFKGLESLNSQSDPTHNSWCASFASWCLQTAGYPNPSTQRALEFNPEYKHDPAAKDKKSGMRQIKEPVFGSIIVWKNKKIPGGHVAFYYGKEANGNIIALGGNQGQSIQFSSRNPSGDVNQSIVGYFLPENYLENEKDIFTEHDLNLSTKALNTSDILALHGSDSIATV